jgi:hypothetical protein
MSESKKPRVMTPRGFLHKASGKVSADAFLTQHRAWLESGELAEVALPILRKLDFQEILPTPALDEIRGAVLDHMLTKETKKAENAILNPAPAAKRKPWMATIYDAKGEIQTRINAKGEQEDLQETFDKSSDADRWTDRRLFEGASDWFGVVSHTTITIKGEPLSTIIMREDAIARILQKPKGPAMKSQAKSSGKLSFGVKVSNDRAVFSKG